MIALTLFRKTECAMGSADFLFLYRVLICLPADDDDDNDDDDDDNDDYDDDAIVLYNPGLCECFLLAVFSTLFIGFKTRVYNELSFCFTITAGEGNILPSGVVLNYMYSREELSLLSGEDDDVFYSEFRKVCVQKECVVT